MYYSPSPSPATAAKSEPGFRNRVPPASPFCFPPALAASNTMQEEWASAPTRFHNTPNPQACLKVASNPAVEGSCIAKHYTECPVRLITGNCWRTKIQKRPDNWRLWYSPTWQPPTCWHKRNRILLLSGSIQGNMTQRKENRNLVFQNLPLNVYIHAHTHFDLKLGLNLATSTIAYSTLSPKTF